MGGAVPTLPQYAFTAWCSLKTQEQLYLYIYVLIGLFSWTCLIQGECYTTRFMTQFMASWKSINN